MCLEGADFPIAFIAGTAARGRSGYGVMLFTDEETEQESSYGESETLHTRICATASGVLAALWSANELNLPYIYLALQDQEIAFYLRHREYPEEPGVEELFRKIYESPMKFIVYDYKGCCNLFPILWSLARAVSGTHSLSPNPINDNLYKNGVIGVTISAFIRKTTDGVSLGAYGFYYEKDLLTDWGRKMNEAGVILDPGCEFDVCVKALNIALFATLQSRHYEIRIKTASRPIHLLIEDFKKTGLESYKSVNGIDGLKQSIKNFDSIEVEYTPDYCNEGIREAYLFTLDEFKSREDSMYWKNGVPKVYTDGSCENNGRGGAVARCGVFWGPDHHFNASFPISGRQTNNRAEYSAIIHALQTAINYRKPRLIIGTDCELIIKSVNEYLPIWRKNGWKTSKGCPVENKDLVMKIDELMGKMESVVFEKVLAHSGHEGNEGADRLAREAVRIAMGLE